MSKKLNQICIQSCINSYGGEHGKVRPVFKDKIDFQLGHVEGHVGEYGKKIILVFRGSDGTADWIDNLKFGKRKSPAGWFKKRYRLHQGFMEQYESIKPKISRILTDYTVKEIVVTGHSLGGALATICAADLSKFFNVELITFGSPRVGTPLFARYVNKSIKNITRYRYGSDPVSAVPFFGWGFHHTKGHHRYIKKLTWYQKLKNIVTASAFDHEPEKYKWMLK